MWVKVECGSKVFYFQCKRFEVDKESKSILFYLSEDVEAEPFGFILDHVNLEFAEKFSDATIQGSIKKLLQEHH